MNFYERHSYDNGQIIFNRILFAFTFVMKMLLRTLAYSPLLFLGYIITRQLLNVKDDRILWIALTIMFAFIVYFIVYFFKGVLIALKNSGNLFWIPVFVCCVIFTCILPVWIIFDLLQKIISRYAETNHEILTWIFALAFGLYVYSRNHFLTDIVPISAYPYYKKGITLTLHLLNVSKTFKARKSQEII